VQNRFNKAGFATLVYADQGDVANLRCGSSHELSPPVGKGAVLDSLLLRKHKDYRIMLVFSKGADYELISKPLVMQLGDI